ncbi:hypothetical protein [Lactobacillus sp. PSON]|uniref:hypothetical protein n=1 Tax=Lactobacillus sp. PSON TaxID=3455454 RepID=UPI004041DFF4
MKQNENIKESWFFTCLYWIIGIVCFFWGGVKHINSYYGICLIITLILPVVYSLIVTLKIKVPHWVNKVPIAGIYLLIVIAVSLAYKLQDVIGYFIPIIFLIVFAILAIFYALYKTFKYRKNGRYYYVEENRKKRCDSFLEAFKEYYLEGLVSGIFEMILAAIFD